MGRSGEPDGMNLKMGDQRCSSVNQEYASGGKPRSIVCCGENGTRQVHGYQGMAGMNMQMETEDEIIKTASVSGCKAFRVTAEGSAYRA